jgi:hypothetical protein
VSRYLLAVLVVCACEGGDVVYAGGGEGGSGGLAAAAQSSGSAKAASSDPLCIPGASVECACPGGTKGAQTCAKDGRSFSTCACEPVVVTETVEVPVAPAGYSGECVIITKFPANTLTADNPACTSGQVLRVNCPTKPNDECAEVWAPNSILIGMPGAFCCSR